MGTTPLSLSVPHDSAGHTLPSLTCISFTLIIWFTKGPTSKVFIIAIFFKTLVREFIAMIAYTPLPTIVTFLVTRLAASLVCVEGGAICAHKAQKTYNLETFLNHGIHPFLVLLCLSPWWALSCTRVTELP